MGFKSEMPRMAVLLCPSVSENRSVIQPTSSPSAFKTQVPDAASPLTSGR